MSIANLTPSQLRLAADLQEKIVGLNQQLNQLLGGKAVAVTATVAKPAKKGGMSAAGRAAVAAAQKTRWAKIKAAKKISAPVKTAAVVKPAKKKISAAGIARIKAAQKARWAKVKAAKPAVKPASAAKAPTRKISPEGIARIKAAQKARWAKFKAAKK